MKWCTMSAVEQQQTSNYEYYTKHYSTYSYSGIGIYNSISSKLGSICLRISKQVKNSRHCHRDIMFLCVYFFLSRRFHLDNTIHYNKIYYIRISNIFGNYIIAARRRSPTVFAPPPPPLLIEYNFHSSFIYLF